MLGVAILSGAGTARAAIVPTLTTITPVGGGDFRWSYESSLNPAEKVTDGDFFTIFDFTGFVPGTNLQPAGWSFSSSNSGVTPTGLLPLVNIPGGITDDPSIPNLTWTYTGSPAIPGPADLGAFSAVSTGNVTKLSSFNSESTEQSGFTAGSKVDNFGTTATPVPPTPTPVPSTVPEPCTLALLGFGALPLALRRRSG
jgi:hypothetical protein